MTDATPSLRDLQANPTSAIEQWRSSGCNAPLSDVVAPNAMPLDQLLDIACIDMITRWRYGHSTPIEHYLSMYPTLTSDNDCVMDLIDAEVCCRRDCGLSLSEADYCERFPGLELKIRKLFAFDATDQPQRLGGYRLMEIVGQGAMGVVFKARQVSLDRIVAVKVIQGKWSGNATVMSRFVREAYAAAKLTHPNVVRIYDFGIDQGKYYFSMEWVRGGTLSQCVREHGPLAPLTAVRHILQSAHGLRFAHQHGMVHRDVKPANLLIDQEGIVKVADLGLVKIPSHQDVSDASGSPLKQLLSDSHDVTGFGHAVGTPQYMAPEQSIDANTVDHRADIYSLGRTLQFLMAPTAEDVGDPQQVASSVSIPGSVHHIIQRSTASRPEDRYDDLTEMITDLENVLGLDSAADYHPTEQQAAQIRDCAQSWHSSAANNVSTYLFAVTTLLCVMATLSLLPVAPEWSVLILAAHLAAVASFVATSDWMKQSELMPTIREIVVRLPLLRWAGILATIAMAYVLLLLTGTLGYAVAGIAIGALIAIAIAYGVCFAHARRIQNILTPVGQLIQELRAKGLSERGLRRFVARYAGPGWLSLYRQLFGYEALSGNQAHAELGTVKINFTIKDRIVLRLMSYASALKDRQDHRMLVTIESRGYASQGLSRRAATHMAWQTATALMRASRELEKSNADQRQADYARRARIKAMLADARSGRYADPVPASWMPWALSSLKSIPLLFAGQGSRLLLGSLLMFAAVAIANHLGLDTGELRQAVEEAGNPDPNTSLHRTIDVGRRPIKVAGFPTSILSIAVAGLTLILTSFFHGIRISAFAIPAAGITLFGPSIGIPSVGTVDSITVCLIAGIVLTVLGCALGRSKESLDQF